MAGPLEYQSPLEDNPYTAGVRRRAEPSYLVDDMAGPTLPDTTTGFNKRVRRAGEGFKAGLSLTEGLARKIVGDEAGAQDAINRGIAQEAEARRIGPDIQTLEDAREAGGGVGNYAEAAATMLMDIAPDMALSFGAAGLARSAALKVAEGSIKGIARRAAIQMAEKRGTQAVDRAARLLTPAATRAVQPAVNAVTYGASAAGEFPGLMRENATALQEGDRADAVKLALGTSAAALIGGLPEAMVAARMISRTAADQIKDQSTRYLARIAKQTGITAGAEGTAEVAQQAVLMATQNWAGQNIDMVGEEAMDAYLMSFFGGGVLGGVLGGGVETGRIGGELTGKAAKAATGEARKLYQNLRSNLALRAQARRDAATASGDAQAARRKPGESMGLVKPDAASGSAQTDVGAEYRAAHEAVSEGGETPPRGVLDILKSIPARFRQRKQELRDADDMEAEAEAEHKALVARLTPGNVSMLRDEEWTVDARAPAPSPAVRLGIDVSTDARRIASRIIPADHPLWSESVPLVMHLNVRSLSKVLEGKPLNEDDTARLNVLRATLPQRMAVFDTVAPTYAQRQSSIKTFNTEIAGEVPEPTTLLPATEVTRERTEAMRLRKAALKKAAADPASPLAMSLDAVRDSPVEAADGDTTDAMPPLSDVDQLRSASESLRTARERGDPPESLQLLEQREASLRQNVVREIRGDVRGKSTLGTNVFSLTARDPAERAKLLAQPKLIGVANDALGVTPDIKADLAKRADSKRGKPLAQELDEARADLVDAQSKNAPAKALRKFESAVQRLEAEATRRESSQPAYALDLSNLMLRYRGKNPGMPAREALAGALADAQMAGVAFDPNTLTPGVVKSNDGTVLIELVADPANYRPKNNTHVLISQLQTTLETKPRAPNTSARAAAVAAAEPARIERLKATGGVADTSLAGVGQPLRPFRADFNDGRGSQMETQSADPGDSEFILGPREEPRGISNANQPRPAASPLRKRVDEVAKASRDADAAQTALRTRADEIITQLKKLDPSAPLRKLYARIVKQDTAIDRLATRALKAEARNAPNAEALAERLAKAVAKRDADNAKLQERAAAIPRTTPKIAKLAAELKSNIAERQKVGAFASEAAKALRAGIETLNARENARTDTSGFTPTLGVVSDVTFRDDGSVSVRTMPTDNAKLVSTKDEEFELRKMEQRVEENAYVDAFERLSHTRNANDDIDAINAHNAGKKNGRSAQLLPKKSALRVAKAAFNVRRTLGVDPLRVFNSVVELVQTTSKAVASVWTTPDGRVSLMVSVKHLLNGDPKKEWGDRNYYDRLLRVMAHETTHGLDHMHAVNNDGAFLSDADAWKADGVVMKEVEAASKNPLLKTWFAYMKADGFKGDVPKELFAQIGAMRARFPELLSENFPEASKAFDAALAEARAPRQSETADTSAAEKDAPNPGDGPGAVKQVATGALTVLGVAPPAPPAAAGPPASPIPPAGNTLRDVMHFVKTVLSPADRQALERALNQPAVTQKLNALYASSEGALRLLDSGKSGLEGRIALAYLAFKDGVFKPGAQAGAIYNSFTDDALRLLSVIGDSDVAQTVFSDMLSGHIEAVRAAGGTYDARTRAEIKAGGGAIAPMQQVANAFRTISEKVYKPISAALEGSQERIRSWGIPSANRIMTLLYVGTGQTDRAKAMSAELVHDTALWLRRATDALDPPKSKDPSVVEKRLTPKDHQQVLTLLQSQAQRSDSNYTASNEVWNAVAELRNVMKELHAHLKTAGVELPEVKDYWPVQMDLRNEQGKEQLRRLLMEPVLEQGIRDHFGAGAKEPIGPLIDKLVEGAVDDPDAVIDTTADAPGFRAMNARVFDFVYKTNDPALIKRLAELQLKDPLESMARYIEPAIRRAAYARRFADDGSRLNTMLASMRKQGATDKQVDEVKNHVAAMMNNYGHAGSPTISLLSPALAGKLAGRKSQSIIQGLQAYQNLRVLPLATVASLIDPMGIAVRTGGDFKTAWIGFKKGFKALYDDQTKAELHEALMFLGSTDEISTLGALSGLYGGGQTPFARKVNDLVFKVNGLAGWTRHTRYMALAAGNAFLVKHADGKTETSRRYLRELGLKAGDVQVLHGGHVDLNTGDAVRDNKVRNALMRFVDDAILRPNSTQRPLWHSDPYMGLVSQYKGFAYAIWSQIGGRLGRELNVGNFGVLLPAMLYAPGVIMAELLRELLQHGPDGDARRKDWGPQDYLYMGWERSNIFFSPMARAGIDALEDVQNKRLAGSGQLGPTLSQARNVYNAASGRRDFFGTLEEAMPASALWKRWNDDGLWDNTGLGAIQESTGKGVEALERSYDTITNLRLL